MDRLGRLDLLANFLEESVIDEGFDMSSYCKGEKPKNECGSAACALGWCTVVFPEDFGLIGRELCFQGTPTYHHSTLIQDFFGISERDAKELFGSHSERTVEEEIKMLREATAAR